MKPFFRLFRFANLCLILLTQVLVYVCLRSDTPTVAIFDRSFLLFLLGTQLVSAAGYVINDYFDVKIDAINKPSRLVVGKYLKMRWAMMIHIVFNFTAIAIAFYLDWLLGFFFMLIAFLLWQYSVAWKRAFLIGNIVIALLLSMTLFSVYIFDQQLDLVLIGFYAVFAFFTGLIREILKDVEDMEGDRAFGCKTIPLVKGFRYTRTVLQGLTIVLLALLAFSVILFLFRGMMIYAVYFTVLLIVPSVYFYVKLGRSDKKRDYSVLSNLIKMIMLAGVLSVPLRLL
jgi:4-hydroxybenzoate polyprenyltransferase